MIKNDRQLKASIRKLKELRALLDDLEGRYTGEDFEFYSLGVREHIRQLEGEISQYRMFKRLPARIEAYNKQTGRLEIGPAIAWLRIGRGLTQEELARRIHCQQENISRLEDEDYRSYTITQLEKIAEALGAQIEIVFRPLKVEDGK